MVIVGEDLAGAGDDRRERVPLVVVHVERLHVVRRHHVLRELADRERVDDLEVQRVDHAHRVGLAVRHVDARRDRRDGRVELVRLGELVGVERRRLRRRRARGGSVDGSELPARSPVTSGRLPPEHDARTRLRAQTSAKMNRGGRRTGPEHRTWDPLVAQQAHWPRPPGIREAASRRGGRCTLTCGCSTPTPT